MKIFLEEYQPIERLTKNKVMGTSDNKVIISDRIETLLHKAILPDDFLCNTPGYIIADHIIHKDDIHKYRANVLVSNAMDEYIFNELKGCHITKDYLCIDISKEEEYNNKKIYLHIIYDNQLTLLPDGVFMPSEEAMLVQVIEQRSAQEANVYIGSKVQILSLRDLINYYDKQYTKISKEVTSRFTTDTILDICPGAKISINNVDEISERYLDTNPIMEVDVSLSSDEAIEKLMNEFTLDFKQYTMERENYLFIVYPVYEDGIITIMCKYKEVMSESTNNRPLFFKFIP